MTKTFSSLFIIWVIFSGHFSPFFLISGIISSLVIIFIILKFTKISLYQPSLRWAKYILWLFYQMITSSFPVTKLIWQKNPDISPKIQRIKHNQKNDRKIAILANSITLTPGTVTIFCDKNYLYFHSLIEKGSLEGVNNIIKQLD
ncbi:MAG: Na+/H+ antiporter subunit E [Rickettsiaceae bacterium H1]|nr:Na+/H+ antiporter subunit E [Rickettsiaceae bacterium H1]